MSTTPQAINVEVGHHIVWHVFGLAWNVDTILATLIAGAILLSLGFYMRARVSVRKPGGVQLFWETVTKWIEGLVEDSMGIKTAPFVVPLAITNYMFILIAT